MTIAILSPVENGYSETFVQAHKKLNADRVLYFYGGVKPTCLEGWGCFMPCAEHHDKGTVKRFLSLFNPPGFLRSGLSIKQYLIYKVLKKNKVDVVLAEFGHTAYDALAPCRKLGIPLVAHFHGRDVYVIDDATKIRYRELFEGASYVVGVSREMVSTLISLGANPDKIVYSPCGADDNFLNVEPRRDEKVFLTVGRFVDKKAPYFTILAFNEALKAHPDIKLKMAGDGPLLDTCRNLVKALGIDGAVEFLGVKTHEEVMDLHRASYAFLQHSITASDGDKEGTPVGVMEAMASSLPVIATRHAGISDLITDGVSGLLCEEGDFRKMGADISKLAADPKLAETLGRNAREAARESFTLNRHLQTLNQTISKAICR